MPKGILQHESILQIPGADIPQECRRGFQSIPLPNELQGRCQVFSFTCQRILYSDIPLGIPRVLIRRFLQNARGILFQEQPSMWHRSRYMHLGALRCIFKVFFLKTIWGMQSNSQEIQRKTHCYCFV